MSARMDVETLSQVLAYDDLSGCLHWRRRGAELFSGTSEHERQANASAWNARYAGKVAGNVHSGNGLVRLSIFDREYYAHKVVWALKTGAWSSSEIEHIDGDLTNNRWRNLRATEKRPRGKELSAFIDDFCIPEPMSGCWIWMLRLDRQGYGRVKYSGKTQRAHRAVYESIHGDQPANMVVRHRCDTPCCVNPDHLSIGTHQDNMDDMVRRGRKVALRAAKSRLRNVTAVVVHCGGPS